MVLPAPAPDETSAPEWIERTRLELRLTSRGVLLAVRADDSVYLRALVLALGSDAPDLVVSANVRIVERVPEGATLILLPSEEDAEWLNLQRPLFAQRNLKVVLFCSASVLRVLATKAVDFHDWISGIADAPPGVPEFAVLGLRAAVRDRVPGVQWIADERQAWRAALEAAFPGLAVPDLPFWSYPLESYPDAERRRWRARRAPWLVVDFAGRADGLVEARWLVAESRRRTRVLIQAGPARMAGLAGFRPVAQRMEALRLAEQRLQDSGSTVAGKLAALLGLEPELPELVDTLRRHGFEARSLVRAFEASRDPAETIASLLGSGGLVDEESLALDQSPIPLLRVPGLQTAIRTRRRALIAEVGNALERGEAPSADRMAVWAAESRRVPGPRSVQHAMASESPGVAASFVEVMLRDSRIPEGLRWTFGALVASRLERFHPTAHWAECGANAGAGDDAVLMAGLAHARIYDPPRGVGWMRRALGLPSVAADADMRGALANQLAHMLVQEGRYREALVALGHDPAPGDSDPSEALRVSALLRAGQLDEAETLARHLLPESDEIAEDFGDACFRAGRYEDTAKVLGSVFERSPTALHWTSIDRLVEALERAGRHSEAVRIVRQWLERDASLFRRGFVIVGSIPLAYFGKLREAEDLLRLAVLGTPLPDDSARGALVETLQADADEGFEPRTRSRVARALTEKGSPLAIPGIVGLTRLSDVLAMQGRHKEAEDPLRLLLANESRDPFHPKLLRPLRKLADLLVRRGAFDEASIHIERARQIIASRLSVENPENARIEALASSLPRERSGEVAKPPGAPR